jgi:haloalkane dehalogenase
MVDLVAFNHHLKGDCIMKTLRTANDRFSNLAGYPFEPNYIEVPDSEGGVLRIHYVDEGFKTAEPVLMMHGEPTWSYLYRKMIPIVTKAGFRVIAPDLVGFGKSDKPSERSDYTYERHVSWMQAWLDRVGINKINLVCQDWGGLIGLRLLANDPDRFNSAIVANTGLPTGDDLIPDAFLNWRKFSLEVEDFDVGSIVAMGCKAKLPDDVAATYNAPFPDDTYKEGARILPSLVPIKPDNPSSDANRKAWEVLSTFDKPFLTSFSDGDPITGGGDRVFQRKVPGAKNQRHITIKGGGHFLQEDCGEEFAEIVVNFIK